MPDFLSQVLTWPRNYQLTAAVRTAMELHLPPTMFILDDKQPTDDWTVADKKLALAYHTLDREKCQKCGQPVWICHSNNKDIQFRMQKGHCYATATSEKWMESRAGKNLKPGDYAYPVPFVRDQDELPENLRQEYLKDLED